MYLFLLPLCMGFRVDSLFSGAVLCLRLSVAIISFKDERDDCFTLIVSWLSVFRVSFSMYSKWIGLQFAFVALPGHTHLLLR